MICLGKLQAQISVFWGITCLAKMSSVQNPGWLFDRGGYTTQLYYPILLHVKQNGNSAPSKFTCISSRTN